METDRVGQGVAAHGIGEGLARRRIFESHEELVAAARAFGVLLARQVEGGVEDLDELEEAAGKLDDAALSYGRARRELGPCAWALGDLTMAEGEDERDPEEFVESSAALYEAAEAVADLTDEGPEGAVNAARTVLGYAAYRFYHASCAVVAYSATLVPLRPEG
jgi:hypothetical protein